MKTAAIVQSNYIPWKGYFDLINSVDEFVLFDDMQYTVRDWRNRNTIKTPNGLMWLTIPVIVKGKRFQKISEVAVSEVDWNKRHWKSIQVNYAKAPFFKAYSDLFESLYLDSQETNLSQINARFIRAICKLFDIETKISWSSDYVLSEGKTERLVNLCKQINADVYWSGPSAKAYMDLDAFAREGIQVTYIDYGNYSQYDQLYPPFVHQVSVLDLIFNAGPNAKKYMASFSTQ